jgi:hypothetical protein
VTHISPTIPTLKLVLAPKYRFWMLALLPITLGLGTAALWARSLNLPCSIDAEGLTFRYGRKVPWRSIRRIGVCRGYLDGHNLLDRNLPPRAHQQDSYFCVAEWRGRRANYSRTFQASVSCASVWTHFAYWCCCGNGRHAASECINTQARSDPAGLRTICDSVALRSASLPMSGCSPL